MTWIPNQGKGHAVHLDNLFTSSKLLTTLQQYGIGAAGTVRTGQTRREANDENRQREQSLLEPAQDDSLDDALDDTLDNALDDALDDALDNALDDTLDDALDDTQDEDLDLGLGQGLNSFNDPNVQHQLNLLNAVIEDMYQSRNPQAESRNPQAQSQNPQAQSQNPQSQSYSRAHTTRVKKPEKEKHFGMNEKLIELKTKWSNHIAWGELYGCLSSN